MTDLERNILKALLKRPLHRLVIFEKLPFGTAETPRALPLHEISAKGWLTLGPDARWCITEAGREALEVRP